MPAEPADTPTAKPTVSPVPAEAVPETSTKSAAVPQAEEAMPAPSSSPAQVQQPDSLIAAPLDENDGDSAVADDAFSSTASISSSILQYRTIQGRTFHSDRYAAQYFTPNDEKQANSVDITHHYLMLLLDGKLFLAPIKDDVQKVLDIGTGTGIWAIDFADQYTKAAKVIGTDLSPIQPAWVPPNVKFEIEDATLAWSWPDNEFDFVHMRYLFGAIADWGALMREAYRCCAPGGWLESCECDTSFQCDDGTTELEPVLKTWWELFTLGGNKLGRTFDVLPLDIQKTQMEKAGFVDIQVAQFKIPVGGWPADPKLAEVGQFVQLTLENDVDGYTLFIWNTLLGWDNNEYQTFLMSMRKAIRNKKVHSYMTVRYVWGRKPE